MGSSSECRKGLEGKEAMIEEKLYYVFKVLESSNDLFSS